MRVTIWKEGRFSWTAILFLVYSAVWILAFDYAWRLVQIPFLQLAFIGVGCWILGVIIIVGVARHKSRG